MIILVLIVSLTFNLLVFFMDTIPFLWPRFKRKYLNKKKKITKLLNPEKQIIKKSLEMAKSSQVTMVWNEKRSFTEGLLKLKGRRANRLFKQYSYPRAFLISGLTDYAKSKNDAILMMKVGEAFDNYIDSKGLPTFNFDKVDQVPFGVAAINLFQFTNDFRYKKFADYIFTKIKSLIDENTGIVLYREGAKVQLNDVLGMICPFLIKYYEINKESNSINIVEKQLKYYILYGVDKETYLPTHGINVNTNIKIGPTNWGRGIGWYILALSEYDKYIGTTSAELNGLITTLEMLKTDDLIWTQFPGHSKQFDASSTTMFMYAINLTKPETYSKKDVLNIFGYYITEDGIIESTSGDTYGLNDYSKTFGDSEFSQGMLLMLLSTTNYK